jgi:beta-glucosidase
MGNEYEKIRKYAAAYVAGLQSDNGKGHWRGMLSTVKHFLGDGATYYGIDEGNDTVHDFNTFLDVNYQGYAGGKDACMGSVMTSYSAVNTITMGINSLLV